MKQRRIPDPKPLFVERMNKLITEEKDREAYWNISKIEPQNSIRCNTIKISPEELRNKLEKRGWKISQPWKDYPEVMIVESDLRPGELGRSTEHLLGYYYIQELSSMLPILALTPKENELILDLCAAPGSKTTQAAAKMKNTGTIIANEVSLGRLSILAINLERCGALNAILSRKDGRSICKNFKELNIQFDKILVDAPCSGEGTIRSSPLTYIIWNPRTIKTMTLLQESLFLNAFEALKVGGEIVYSTCTHAPEENEEVIDYFLKKLGNRIEVLDFELPIKTRPGITTWENKEYDKRVQKAKRVYPQDNNTEGFFVSKFRKVKE